MYDSRDIARMFVKFVGGEPPCSYNGLEERCDEWCENNCDIISFEDCWQHAIEEGWLI